MTYSGRVVVKSEPSDAVELLQVDVAFPPKTKAVDDDGRVQINLELERKRNINLMIPYGFIPLRGTIP